VFNPAVFNPAVFNPAVFNPAVFNPAVFNPAVFNPAVFNPAVFNISTTNPAVFNPAVFNPAVFNGTIVETVETSVVIENNGNATAAYSLNLDLQSPPAGFLFQIMIYKTYLVPSVEGCTLTETVEQEALVSELQPDVNGSLLNPDSTSFFVAPGDNVVVTVRVVPDPTAAVPGNTSTLDTLAELDLSQSVVPQAVDTTGLASGETQPEPVVILAPSLPPLVIDTTVLPNGSVGAPYSATLTTTGGGGSPVIWSVVPGTALPPGLSLTAAGQIVGTPTTQGAFAFDVRANDGDQLAEQSLSITITAASGVLISQNSSFGVDTITLDTATGLKWLDVTLSMPYSYDQLLVQLQPGGVFDGYRLATQAEVLTLWQNAGINTGPGFLNIFTSPNFQPVVDLMAFVGITGLNTGNLGGGNFFDFTAGHIESGPGGGGNVNVATISADPAPTVTGRPGIGFVPSNNPNTQHGAWLISNLPVALVNVALTTTTLNIGGPTVAYTASINNSTASTLSGVVLQAFVDQPGASRAAGGLLVRCGAALGDLAPGPCNENFTVIASNATAGSGTLIPGPAIARFELQMGATVLDTFSVAVTLVP
ncbi:MAG: hypothetical protein ACE5OQ_13570, partial [Woeseia sp.]